MTDESPSTPPPAPPAAATPPVGPWALVWREFRRRGGAMWGLGLVVAFWLLALFAPFLAHRLPLVWIEDGAWSFPLLREFLCPYDLRHEGGLEQSLAFTLVFLPLAIAVWWAAGRWGPAGWRQTRRGVALALGALLAVGICLSLGQIVWRAAGQDPLYSENYPAVNLDDILHPARLAAWIASGADGIDAVADAFSEEERAAFAQWPSQYPDADDPYDAPADQRNRARVLAAGLNRVLFSAPWDASATGKTSSYRERQLRAALADPASAQPALLRDLGSRLNRLALETHAPDDAIRSFRTFRSGFVIASLMALVAGLGVAAIILTGANELRADGRWLLVCLTAALVLPVFLFEWRSPGNGADTGQTVLGRLAWRTPRNQIRDYRADAAAGKGWGLFPPLAFGPDEQGFGPKLPPTWADPPAQPTAADVADWMRLGNLLAGTFAANLPADADPALPARRHIWSLLPPDERNALPAIAEDHWRRLGEQLSPESATGGQPPQDELLVDDDTLRGLLTSALTLPEGRSQCLASFGRLLGRADFYDADAFAPLRVTDDFDVRPYLVDLSLAGDPARETLSPRDTERRNRLLLQKAFPGVFKEQSANQWKKPHQKAGYHWFGTDESGRDVLTRMLHGARVSLSVGFVSVALATLIGLVAGALAAYYGGWVDWLVSRAIELMMCFPAFFLILAMIAVLDKRSILNIMMVIGFTGWTGVARLVRGEILQQRALDYVASAQAMGAGDARIIFRHILPNALAPVFVSVTFGITGAILTESGLSFLGLGVTPPTPTWGQLLAEAREAPMVNWWLAVFPGAALFLGVFSYNLVGEGVRDALDPRLRGGLR